MQRQSISDKQTRSRKQNSFYDGVWLHPVSYSNNKDTIFRLHLPFGYKCLISTNGKQFFVLGNFAGLISACVVVVYEFKFFVLMKNGISDPNQSRRCITLYQYAFENSLKLGIELHLGFF